VVGLRGRLTSQLGRWRQLTFVRSVSLLVGGGVLAQVILALSLLVVSRLYSPQDFSLLAVFAGIVGWGGAIACLRFDVALPLPRDEEDAANMFMLAVALCTLFSAFVALLVLLAPEFVSHTILRQPALQPVIWMLPIAIFSFGCYSALQNWSVRRKAFDLLVKARVAHAASGAGAQIGFGLSGVAPAGLLLGQVFNGVIGSLFFFASFAAKDVKLLRKIRWGRLRELFKRYQEYPKYSVLEVMCNAAATQVPIFIIAAVALGPEAGHLMLALSVMQAPVGLLGSAVSQVYVSRAAEQFRAGTLDRFTTDVFGGLLRTGVGPLCFAGLVGPGLFEVIFGSQWQRAGELVAWMTPWFAAHFLAVPIALALYVTNNQRSALIFQAIGCVLRILVVYSTSVVAPHWLAEVFAISGFLYYGAFLVLILHAASARLHDLGREFAKSGAILALWIAAGALLALAHHWWMS
jgi:O-antigen/teichoic acid export membrane protein